MDDRKKMGADKDGVIFPIAPKLSEMSDSYLQFIEKIKDTIQQQRISVVLNANASMICLYWNIGQAILQKQADEGWGAKVIDRIAADIKAAFPEMSGFSPRNIMPRREVEIERKLTEHIQNFLLELGQGFAFVGRQVHLEVGGQDFYLDLLFYHLKLRCYVVIELKTCDFEPGFISQLNMYQNVVNDILRHPDDKPTIGLLLVKGKNETVVEYSLAGYQNPIGVAEWKNQIAHALPDELKSSLPTIEEIERELE